MSEQQWGTVREDYSADGNAWDYLPHDHARSRAYRWGRTAWPGSATSTSGCACTKDENGRRACFGGTEKMQTDPAWHDNLIFSEYFHGDNSAAIGAFHQIGWTGLIADMILRRHGVVKSIGDVVRELTGKAQS